ncbi:hypothetical protein [Maridesulfovibrio hydrothermalis]|uniref:Uncharacterized protein n=1 Tax=Maridesulfovibrio hydrothermalis AM13 = DSM 14728 TaxID=1121451 RepID=L0R984_9BACT|nr:hypothetical protein [Maridesulfovibrio hydrothermalis]CCO23318.1 conserved protein of unknown function [Maridesulfovibrio hydrothermalis AM13 = DSM 14728]
MKIAEHGINRYADNAKLWSWQTEAEVEKVTARVKTRSFGFTIGKLGVNFTAKDLEFEPGEAEKASQDFRSKTYPRTQREERHVQNIYQQLALTQATLSEDSATFNPGSSGYMRTRAVNAYSQQSGALNYTLPGSALGKV